MPPFPDEDEECGVLSEGSETSEGGRADTDDEGIERDSEPAPRRRRRRRRFMLKDVVEVSWYLYLCNIFIYILLNIMC